MGVTGEIIGTRKIPMAGKTESKLNDIASVYHFRNTMNKQFPFHCTLKLLSNWLVKEADDFEGRVTQGVDWLAPNDPTSPLVARNICAADLLLLLQNETNNTRSFIQITNKNS